MGTDQGPFVHASAISLGVGYRIYQHVSSVLAGFAILVLIGHVFHFEWRGVIQTLVRDWESYVRTPIREACFVLISIPLKEVLGIDFRIPSIGRDYLSVGVIYFASLLRASVWYHSVDRDLLLEELRYSWNARSFIALAMFAPFAILFWPILVFFYLLSAIGGISNGGLARCSV